MGGHGEGPSDRGPCVPRAAGRVGAPGNGRGRRRARNAGRRVRRPGGPRLHAVGGEALSGDAAARGGRRKGLSSRRRRDRADVRVARRRDAARPDGGRDAAQGRLPGRRTSSAARTPRCTKPSARGARPPRRRADGAPQQLLGQACGDAAGVPPAGTSRRRDTSSRAIRCSVGSARSSRATPGIPESKIVVAVDGCSLPVFRLPLSALAAAYARLLAGRLPGEERGRRRRRARGSCGR